VEFSEKYGYNEGLLYGSSVSPDLRDRIQLEVIAKMDVAEAFVQTAMDKGIYRAMNPRLSLRCFRMFAIAGFSHNTLMSQMPRKRCRKWQKD